MTDTHHTPLKGPLIYDMCRYYTSWVVPSFVSVLLSQVLWFVSASLTPFLLSLMCLICLVTVLVHVHCFVSTSRRSYFLRCLRVSRCSSSALYVPCFVWLSITMLSQVLHLSITPLMCLALSQHDITPLFSALPFPLDIFQATRSIAPRCYKVVQWIRN